MSHIIRKKVKNTIYVYEEISYRNENGKVKHKQRILGKLDADGNVIPSKKSGSAEVVSLESLKASLSALDDSLNSQNSQNVNATNDATVFGNNNYNGNDEIITASTNVNNSNNANNNVTTMPMPDMPDMYARHAIPATATNNPPIAVAPATTVPDSVNNASDVPNIPVTSDELAMSVAMSTAKTDPMADNISDNISYDAFAETHAEASIAAEASTPPRYSNVYEDYEIVDDNDVIINDISKISPEAENSLVSAIPAISTKSTNTNVPDTQDAGGLVAVVDVTQASTEEKLPQLPQVTSQKAEQFKFNMSKIENVAFTPSKNVSVYEATSINDVKVNVSRGKSAQEKGRDFTLH